MARYVTDPRGFGRGLQRVFGEVIKERFQARRQIRRDLVPRIDRDWTFAGLRAATNVLQRDLNTSVLAEELAAGTRSIYVDYVDYDEVAHHAGIFRPESLASLDGLDRVLATLERLAERAPRRYHLVVVSDHGQSQGEPFAARFGIDLGDLCSDLMAQKVQSVASDIEGWGRAGAIATDVAGTGLSGKVAARAAARVDAGRGRGRRRRLRGGDQRARLGQPRPALRARPAPAHAGGDRRAGGRPWSPGSAPTRASASSPASMPRAVAG